jgi:hypothetical protein
MMSEEEVREMGLSPLAPDDKGGGKNEEKRKKSREKCM